MGWIESGRRTAAFCFVVLLTLAPAAAAGVPTSQELLAEGDQALVNQVAEWDRRVLALPDDIELDAPLRDAAASLMRSHEARVRELLPAWIAQERAQANAPALRGRALAAPIYQRMINEMAIWSVESAGPERDEAWLKAALAPTACRVVPQSVFGRQMALIQAAPQDARAALLASERDLISRWGSQREKLPPRPSVDDLNAVDQAIARLRAGLPITAGPMAPYLAGLLFNRDRKPGRSDRWETCAKSQWWLAARLADAKADRAQALAVYRYSTMVDAREFVPPGAAAKPAASGAAGGNAYPPAAAYFNVEGATTVRVETDDHGVPVRSEVQSRKIVVPGVRDNRPVAFETLLDDAALDVAARRRYPDGKVSRDSFEIAWHMK